MPNDSSVKIKILAKTVAVLRAISLGKSRLSDITRDVKLSKNQVFRILVSLRDEGIVVQDPVTRGYFMGPLLFEITMNPLKTHESLINAAYLEMDNLKEITGETISLDIKFGMEKITLRQVIGTHNLTYIGRNNPVAHLWIGSVSKVLLAQLDEQEIDSLLENVALSPTAPTSITEKEAFKQQIREVQKQGYATSFSEIDIGVGSVATPIAGYIVPAALTIIGAEDRMTSRLDEYIEKLRYSAGVISRKLMSSR